MTVKELVEALLQLDPNLDVFRVDDDPESPTKVNLVHTGKVVEFTMGFYRYTEDGQTVVVID